MAIRKQTHRQLVKESGMIARECAVHIGMTLEEHKRTINDQIEAIYTARAQDISTVTQMRADLTQLVAAFEEWKKEEGGKITEIHSTVTQISMVKLNGGPAIPIGDAMRELWMATAGIRSWGKVAQSYHEWQEKTTIGRVTRTKIGRLLVWGGVAFLVAAVLNFTGILAIDIAAATKWVLQIIFKQGVQP